MEIEILRSNLSTEILPAKGQIVLTVYEVSEQQLFDWQEIFVALLQSGGLNGVKGGKTILHFDEKGIFQGIELDYKPWWRRKKLDTS